MRRGKPLTWHVRVHIFLFAAAGTGLLTSRDPRSRAGASASPLTTARASITGTIGHRASTSCLVSPVRRGCRWLIHWHLAFTRVVCHAGRVPEASRHLIANLHATTMYLSVQ